MMVKYGIFISFLLLIVISCSQSSPVDKPNWTKEPDQVNPVRPVNLIKTYTEEEIDSIQNAYKLLLERVNVQRRVFKDEYVMAENDSVKTAILTNAKEYLIDLISSELLPRWYGTDWEFEGHTNVPQKGAVACGYFVSTPLKHIGFNLNRYRMAQKYSHEIIKSLCDSNLIIIFDKNVLGEKLIDLAAKDDDIYLVGLDCHVGFIINRNHQLRFVHSNYMFPVKVVEENIFESEAFIQSEKYVVGSLFGSENFTIKWINNDTIQ